MGFGAPRELLEEAPWALIWERSSGLTEEQLQELLGSYSEGAREIFGELLGTS